MSSASCQRCNTDHTLELGALSRLIRSRRAEETSVSKRQSSSLFNSNQTRALKPFAFAKLSASWIQASLFPPAVAELVSKIAEGLFNAICLSSCRGVAKIDSKLRHWLSHPFTARVWVVPQL